MDVLHAAIAIALAILLIIRFKVDPVISLVLSSLYLGLAAGVGLEGTVAGITGGFGEIMAEVGLLIGFGVLIGSLLSATGTFRTLVEIIARRVGGKLPYAMAGVLSTIFPSIYVDVQVVLASPMARQAAPVADRTKGLPWLAGSIGIGIFAGYVFVVPGLAAVAVAGLLKLPLGRYLVFGLPLGILTALVTAWLFRQLLTRTRYWDPTPTSARTSWSTPTTRGTRSSSPAARWTTVRRRAPRATSTPSPPAPPGCPRVRLLPILVPLVLIAFGAFADLLEFSNGVIAFLGDANIALFIGLVIAFVLARWALGTDSTGEALSSGFRTTGEILLITGIGGSLGAIITETGLGDTLKELFSADSGAPAREHPARVVRRRGAALRHRLGVGRRDHGGRHHRPGRREHRGRPGRHRPGDRLGRDVRAARQQQLLLDVQVAARPVDEGALKTLTMATSLGAVVSLPVVLVLGLVL